MLRPARPTDAGRLREIERAAGAAFADVGMPEVAEEEPWAEEQLVAYATAGRSWVIADQGDEAVGYVVVDIVDGCAHVEQVSVHPDHQGLGLGRALLDEVERWARRQRMPALTLTTFTEVPWNGPLYAHLGFVPLADDELGPGLRAVRVDESAHGLDPDRRLCMRRPVEPAP
ncbi:MAG: GNAT family N-acetyltransferase [Actinomycetota bacterium]|nr:GNAT family N-acetyltransferase [Actinomycetota bacterium]